MKPLTCPLCHSPEVNPETGTLNIRAYKVNNWSQCLRNDLHGTVRLNGEETDVTSFWFNKDQTVFEINHKRYVQQ